VFSDGSIAAEGVGELEDEVCIKGLDDWPTIEEQEKIVCLNFFRSTHYIGDCEYVLATVISESPMKDARTGEPGVECLETIAPDAVKENCSTDMVDGLNDEDLNKAYDELLMQKFNPNAKDFKDEDDNACED
jgi:hypothetical protein